MFGETVSLLPGQEWPPDLYTHTDCVGLVHERDYGEDFLDLFAGCVLGALEQGDVALARNIVFSSNATAAEKAAVRAFVVKLVGEPIAKRVFDASGMPWYKNWKVLVPVGAGVLLLGGLTVWAIKRKK